MSKTDVEIGLDIQIAAYSAGISLEADEIVELTYIVKTLMADAWDEAAEATGEWAWGYSNGNNGPSDPPHNPYEEN